MNRRSISRKNRRSPEERGFYLVLTAAILTAIFALLGLAVDSANLYRAHLRLQRAVDAGAVGATYLFGEQLNAVIEDTAVKIAQNNLAQMSMSSANLTVGSTATSVNVQASMQVPLFFMKMIPGIGSTRTVQANASAETAKSIVSLVLDISGSMNDPANPPQSTPTKLQKLKDAAVAFVNLFDESTDKIALVTFNETANAPKHMVEPFNKAKLVNLTIPGLTAPVGGLTNIQAGIQLGQTEIDSVPSSSGFRKVLVLVTDGAPTASQSGTSTGCSPELTDTDRRRHYNRAILASNNSRTLQTTLYTIGFGPNPIENSDPYQNLAQDHLPNPLIKSYLLRRLANSTDAASNPSFDCLPSYNNYNSTSGLSKGIYLQTPDANQLQSLLVSVGRSIKARMIQ